MRNIAEIAAERIEIAPPNGRHALRGLEIVLVQGLDKSRVCALQWG
jgi:hypothetical protein